MTKKSFLSKLRIKLEILEKEEIDDIISEYSDHIDNKINQGKTEKEAVLDFGDIDTLADEILSAYKIKTKKVSSETKFETFINTLVENCIQLFSRVFDSISEQKTSKIISTIIYVIFGLIIISFLMWFVRIPFEIAYEIGDGIIGVGPNNALSNIILFILKVFIEVIYFIVVIMIIASFIKRGIEYFDNNKVSEKIEPKVDAVAKKIKEESKVVIEEVSKRTDDKVLYNFLILAVKIFVVFTFYIPLIASDVGLAIGLGFVIFIFLNGIYSFGLLLSVLGSLIISMALTVLVTKFLFYKGGEE